MATKKQNFQITEELKKYLELESEKLGMSQSGLINMCIARYKEEQEGMAILKGMGGLTEMMDKLQESMKQIKSGK